MFIIIFRNLYLSKIYNRTRVILIVSGKKRLIVKVIIERVRGNKILLFQILFQFKDNSSLSIYYSKVLYYFK